MSIYALGPQRPTEVDEPPPSIAPPPLNVMDAVAGILSFDPRRKPPTYVYTQRREPIAGVSYLMTPDDQSRRNYDLNIGWQEAPDPIRQSPFWDAGNKCHPQAHMEVRSQLAIGSIEAVSEQTFHIGKLLGYIHRPMYAGGQHPSLIRANIIEPVPSTYGSQYIVQGVVPAGPLVTPTGFSEPQQSNPMLGIDGYPY